MSEPLMVKVCYKEGGTSTFCNVDEAIIYPAGKDGVGAYVAVRYLPSTVDGRVRFDNIYDVQPDSVEIRRQVPFAKGGMWYGPAQVVKDDSQV